MMVMKDMLKDFLLGEHLLLVGNQVGDIWKTVSSIQLLALLKKIPLSPEKKPCWDSRAFIHAGPIMISVTIPRASCEISRD